jgi:hypothetical protein
MYAPQLQRHEEPCCSVLWSCQSLVEVVLTVPPGSYWLCLGATWPRECVPCMLLALLILPTTNTASRAGLTHHNLGKTGEQRLKPLPYPPSQVFACRVLESLNLIKIVMIQPIEQWLESCLDPVACASGGSGATVGGRDNTAAPTECYVHD